MILLEKVKNVLFAALLISFAAALLCSPTASADAAREGLSLCLHGVLPSLFPFFVLSSLLVSSGAAEAFGSVLRPLMRPLFSLSGAGAGALVLGLVGGYPVGARTAAELYCAGALRKTEAERLLGFCNNAGPGFILGFCGATALQNERAGAYLYLVHVAAALLTGLLLRGSPLRAADASQAEPRIVSAPSDRRRTYAAQFTTAVRDSFAAVWSVCGYVVIFAVLLRFVTLLLPDHPLLAGFIELTNGVLALGTGREGFVRCAVLLGWGGLSVHAQTLSVLEDSGLSTKRYFLGKALQAALSAPLAWVVSSFLYG